MSFPQSLIVPLKTFTTAIWQSKLRLTLALALLLAASAGTAMQLATRAFSSNPQEKTANVETTHSTAVKRVVKLQEGERSKPYTKLRDGHVMSMQYVGDERSRALLAAGAESRALATSDLDGDGAPDLIAGYATNGVGIVTVQRGNIEAYAPKDDASFVRMQQGYNPDSVLPIAETFEVPEAADYIATGDFNGDGLKDIAVGARNGGLYLLAGNGNARLSPAQRIELWGTVTALAAGELNLEDGKTELAVAVTGSGRSALEIYEGSSGELRSIGAYDLAGEAVAIQFGQLDDDPFGDLAVAAGQEILIVHGWPGGGPLKGRAERLRMPFGTRGLTIGNFVWDREARAELAVLDDAGNVHVLEQGGIDKRTFSEEDLRTRRASRDLPRIKHEPDQWLFVPRWEAGKAKRWSQPRIFGMKRVNAAGVISQGRLVRSNIARQETEEVLVVDSGQKKVNLVRQQRAAAAPAGKRVMAESVSASDDITTDSLEISETPAAVLGMPSKVNGSSDLVMLASTSPDPVIVPLHADTTITVDRLDDSAAAAAAVCDDAIENDCSLRGAVAHANTVSGSTITIPAGTYQLTIPAGSIEFGGANICSHPEAGDLDINLNTTLMGAGAATTIIQQTQSQDRVLCLNPNVIAGRIYSISGVTVTGGREVSKYGGAGIVGGARNDTTTITSTTFTDNQAFNSGACPGCSDFGSGGGAIKIEGGTLNITNCTIGADSLPSAAGSAVDITKSNSAGAGGGVNYSPGAPLGCSEATPCTGNLNMTGTTVKNNTAFSIASGGGGIDLYQHNLGTGTFNIGTSTITGNRATGGGTPNVGGGGGIIVETGPLTVTGGVSITNNIANGNGGGLGITGGSVAFNSTGGAITFSGNTANGASTFGSGIFANSGVSVTGTGLSITNDVQVADNSTWTNNAGSSVAITNLRLSDISAGGNVGTYTANNSTTNLTGNLTVAGGLYSANTGTANIGGNLSITSGTFNNGTTTNLTGNFSLSGGTFLGSSGTVNITGNFTFSGGTFTANTSTFNFNSAVAQSITGPSSPTFNNLTKTGAGTLTLAIGTPIAGNLNVSAGTLNLSTFLANRTAAGGTLTVANGATLRIGGTNTLPSSFTTHSIGATSTIDYSGTNQNVATLLSSQKYGNLVTSGSGTKTLAGNLTLPSGIATSLTIGAGTTLDVSGSNFGISFTGATWTNNGTFNPRSGTVTFDPTGGIQLLVGNTTFFNLTLQNTGATTNLGSGTNTIQSTFSKTAGAINGGSGTFIFTGNPGSIAGGGAKEFHNLTINAGANITHGAGGGDLTLLNDYTNNGTFTQNSAITTTFASGADGNHSFSGGGTTTFGVFTINSANTVDAGAHNFNVVGAVFTVAGTFTGNTSTVSFNGAGAQGIAGDGAKNFSGLLINNPISVNVINGAGAVDASVSGLLTLTSDLSVSSTGPAILQQSGTSAGAGDVVGTVRRTDLGATERSFGNVNNSIQINSGVQPTQLDFNLVKSAPGTFPPTVKVVPRDITLTPTGGGVFSATLKLRYIDPTELTPTSITESRLILWKNIASTWTPQGGTVNTGSDFVSLSGVNSFSEWAIAEGSDLTLTKVNNTSDDAVTGESWNWTLTATNTGTPATFTAGQTILTDNLPNSNLNYGTPTVQNATNITGSANISCSIVSNDLTCTANGGDVTFDSNLGASSFEVVFSATPQAVGVYQNPRSGGTAQIDPNNVIVESNEGNNTAANNTVTVTKANTTTTITNAAALSSTPSVVGEAVTVQWSVTVNAPGSPGAALTGNVTVSDGTNSCTAPVADGQCNITFTSAGAKNITATYAGDSNYNGSTSTPATPHTVNTANTTTTITEDNPDPSTPGQAVLVKYTVTVDSPGSGTPTGTVTVSDGVDSNNTCTVADGVTGCSLTLNTDGNRTITATYLGNADFNTSSDTEDHQVCGSSVVTTTADSGAGSLRQVIADACDGGTITFDTAGAFSTPQTITLTSGELAITKNLTIDAPDVAGQHVTISGNVAGRVFNINSGKTAAIVGLTISGGSALNGGAVLNDGTLTLKNSTVSGNASTQSGGGIHNSNVLNIVNSTISGNNSTIDGGGIVQDGVSPTLYMVNSTVSGNTANGFAGGLDLRNGTATILNSTITGNHGDNDDGSGGGAGGIRQQTATVTIRNTIVGGNYLGSGTATVNDIEGTVDGNSNLIGDAATAGGLTNGVNGNIVGAVIATVLDTVLANNGGPTKTHRLIPGSAALDAGETGSVPTDVFDADGDGNDGEPVDVDQRGVGYPRTADSSDPDAVRTVDIGAFELHPSIEDIGNKTTSENTAVPQFSFHLGDAIGVGSPLIQSITASSSNTTLIPDANVVISAGASDTVRNVNITPASNQTGTSTITITVTATNGQMAVDTFDVTVNPPDDPVVNDPPVNSVPGAQNVNEDAVLTFNAANSNLISISDPDATTAQVTLTATNGTISLSGIAGLTFTPPADGVADAQMTFTGSIADINAALNGMTYTPTADFNGAASLTIVTDDQGNTGTGGPKSDTDVINITVTSVNDPPSFTLAGNPPTVGIDSGAQTVNGFASNISQGPNETGQTLTFNLTPAGTTGTLAFTSGPDIDETTGNLTYTATAGTSGTATFNVTLSDDGGGTDTSAVQQFTISVVPQLALIVNVTGDAADINVGDNICDSDPAVGNQCTLRAAIQETNNAASDDTIGFDPALTGSTITLNTALDAINGNLVITGLGASNLTVARSSVGVTPFFRIFKIDSGNIVSISGLTISNGLVPAAIGGGIWNELSTLNISDCTLSGNSAVHGGGINNNLGTLNVTNTTFSGNSSTTGSGGAILNQGTLNVINSTFSGNSGGTSGGGGIATIDGTATITNCTLTDNSAGEGGGISTAFGSQVNLRNSIVALNTSSSTCGGACPLGSPDLSGTTFTSLGHNIVGSTSGATITAQPGDKFDAAASPLNIGPLANNGGPTQTHALLVGSVALDTGDNCVTDNSCGFSLTTDQRGAGFARVVDGPDADTTATVDIGAFEAQVSVQDIGDRSINEDGSDSFAFDVGGSASITSVTATSSNTALVPNNVANLDVTGSGSTRTLTITPVANGFGSTTITVTVNTATDNSAVDTFLFTVNAVADTPSVTNGSTTEDTITPLGQLVISRNVADGAEVTHFKITGITNGTLFQNDGVTPINNEFITFAQGNAGLRFLPAANSSATGSFTVQAATGNLDAALGGGTATAMITVSAVNDQPTLDPITPNPLDLLEDAGLQNVNLTGISAGGGETQTLVVTASSNNTGLIPNPTVTYTSPNATGSISFTPVANANGTAEITVTVDDNSGGTETVSRTFTVNVAAVNDAPSFTKGANQVVDEDAGAQTVAGWATAISAGPANESGQTVTFEVTNNTNSGLFSTQPAVSSTGTLTYTPAANTSGSATITLRIADNGGTANGGQDTSATQTFDITVNAVNDAPVNTVPGAQSTATNTPLTFSAGNSNLISIADIDAGTNAVQVTLTGINGTVTLSGTTGLSFTVEDGTADATMTFTGTITDINAALNGLVFTPTAGFSGAASLQIVTNDQGNTGSGGAQSDTDTINITVQDGGTLQFSSATYAVNENGGPATITITRTGGSAGTATVLFETSHGTADASDYTTVSQTVTFVDGDTSETVNIPITNDSVNEPDETVNLTLSNAGGSGALGAPLTAVLTILDDDPAGGIFGFSAASYTVGESSGPATITVERTGDLTQAVTVDFRSSDHSDPADFVPCSSPGAGLASSRCDFTTAAGTLKFVANQSSATFLVLISQDNYVEGTETLSLSLSNPTGGAILGVPEDATLSITDDATEDATNPIDISSEFVRQHYRDFLHREPDAPGLAFWTDNIEKCNDPARRPPAQTVAQCIDKQRESTATAFFLAPEFQMTGGFVYRLYKGSLPGVPDYDNSSPGRFPTFVEFLSDVRQVSEGIIVNDQISGPVVEANRDQLAADFVQRPEFVAHYGALNNTQYVNELFNITGIVPTAGDKQALIDGLNNSSLTRANVLRKVVDGTVATADNDVQFTTAYGQAFYDQEFRRVIVYMEYIGYLRRNPDAPGFVHWLGKLNFFGGDMFQAEMVRAFILSPEYRSRFGQP